MTAVVLKILAMLSMLTDHCDYLFHGPPVCEYIGRLAFPLYAFLLVDSYRHLRSHPERMKKYVLTLAVLAVVSEFAYDFAFTGTWVYWEGQNQILQFLSFVLAALLAERMLRHFGAKNLHIIWFGGEPLMNPQVIWNLTPRLRSLAEQYGAKYSASIFTNGSLVTQEILDRLKDCGVESAVIAVDGMGEAHDRTRHYKGGAGSFDRITHNLRTLRFPFPVSIRHLLTEDNTDQMAPLEAYVAQLRRESGNRLFYAPDTCGWNHATDDRQGNVHHMEDQRAAMIGIRRDMFRFVAARGRYCGAATLASVSVDARGELYSCWPEMDNREGRSFGIARTWDPARPFETAARPEILKQYLDTALPNGDEECWECRWLPFCVGGCPYKRVNKAKECLPYKNRPEDYVLALYRRMKAQVPMA